MVGGNSANSTLTVNNSSADTYSGVLGGAGTNQNKLALIAGGTSTLTLSGANTYSGGTTVSSEYPASRQRDGFGRQQRSG